MRNTHLAGLAGVLATLVLAPAAHAKRVPCVVGEKSPKCIVWTAKFHLADDGDTVKARIKQGKKFGPRERVRLIRARDDDRILGRCRADLLAQLDDDPLRRALADPGHGLQPRGVAGRDRAEQLARRAAGEHGQRHLRADRLHADQQQEQVALLLGGEAVELHRVVADHEVRVERRLPRGWTHEDLAASIQQHFEEVVRRYLKRLFTGQQILEHTVFRVTRDAELELDDEGLWPDLLQLMEGELQKRRTNAPVRLEIEKGTTTAMLNFFICRKALVTRWDFC